MNDFSDVINLLYETRDKPDFENLLVSLTTPKEREEIAQRLGIVEQILAGNTQHAIAKNLGVGVATVTRGSKELRNGGFAKLTKESADE